jgi:hypothetical protein
MKLTAGEIYFLGERDVKTKEVTAYIKIGIVRDGAKGPRTSEERLVEHQTGNPRELFLHDVIHTAAVEEIETRLHKSFAQNGVNGEWFQLTPMLLDEAVLRAKHLRDEVKQSLSAFEKAESLKWVISNLKEITPSLEAKAWHSSYLEANEIIRISLKLKEKFENLILESTIDAKDVAHILTKQFRSGALSFDAQSFQKEHPKFYSKYTQKEVIHFQRFRVVIPNSQNYSLLESNPLAWELLELFRRMLEIAPETTRDCEMLHDHYLKVIGAESDALWKKQIAEAQLKVLCAEHQGIENICAWPREKKESENFNQVLFASENPDLYSKYLYKRDDVEVTIVEAKKNY